MKKYPNPKPFNPSAEDQKRVAEKLAKDFSPNKVLVTDAGDKIQGTKKSKQTMGIKLSKREIDVLNCLKRGMKNREIAKELSINEKSVSTYILRAKQKLNIDLKYNTYFLVTTAISLGCIEKK